MRDFDWELLKYKNTIGCNDAYRLGADRISVLHFGDARWYSVHQDDLKRYNGIVTTSLELLRQDPRILYLPRRKDGLAEADDGELAWNGNTGISAVNLALLFGAMRIYLLGFDLKLGGDGEGNWYINRIHKPNAGVYDRFREGWEVVAEELPVKYPGVEIINLNPDSELDLFRRMTWEAAHG